MPSRLYVSANRRFLITEEGKPFFWLGDTAWELFHRCTRDDAELYLENRKQKGFTVIQAVVLAEFEGIRIPNAYGHVPLAHEDPTQPNEDYFAHVDFVIKLASEKGLYIGLLPTWGDKVHKLWGVGPTIFNPENAYIYGQFLAKRYHDQTNIVWIIGGDRPEVRDDFDASTVWRAMAAGIRSILGHRALMTYHPAGGRGSSQVFHYDSWLDMNMWQSGHVAPDRPNWEYITQDYALIPPKPVLDGEPNYEDHPIDPFTRKWVPGYGYFRDHDVRKQAYRGVFAGACGHTYGHHSVWQYFQDGRDPVNYPDRPWQDAINRPGASQLIHLRRLIESRPFLTRVPHQGLLASTAGEGGYHIRATGTQDGAYALVYIPAANQIVQINMDKLSGKIVTGWWYDPRTGAASVIGEFPTSGVQSFTTPHDGPDWVLVLDNQELGFPAPGTLREA